MSGALALAASIAAMDRDSLSRLVRSRRVLSPSSVNDSLGLAIELLRPDSITRALQSAHRDSLRALQALEHDADVAGDTHPSLIAAGLVGIDPGSSTLKTLPEVLAAITNFELESAESPNDSTAEVTVDTAGWYGAALAVVRRAAHLLGTLARRSARLGRKGRVSAISLRELAEAIHCDADTTERLVDLLRQASLVVEVPWHDATDHLVTSAESQHWLSLDYPQRWLVLAGAATTQIDQRMRLGLDQANDNLAVLLTRLSVDFPLLPQTDIEAHERAAATAEDVGLTVGGQLTAVAKALLAENAELASSLASESIPAPVDGVYLQPDLSLIVPGPLNPADELALDGITETEHLGPAASLRVSSSSLARAVRAGITTTEIRELLERLSLTGIPQPLDFLLNDIERKLAESTDTTPSPTSNGLAAMRPMVHPAAARHTLTPPPSDTRQADELRAMVDRVFNASQNEDGNADLVRRLELAIRDRSTVLVTAAAGSDERVFTLSPVSLRGGRLRATDQQAGVERTLPVRAIKAVQSA